MKERPIRLYAHEVSAVLDGRQTQLRRIVKPQPTIKSYSMGGLALYDCGKHGARFLDSVTCRAADRYPFCPYGVPGDRLWVKETHKYFNWSEDGDPCMRYAADGATEWPTVPLDWSERVTDIWAGLSSPENYAIDNCARDRKWRPSIHMPRWASRIDLELTGVRVERLQDISEADAIAEGVWKTVSGHYSYGDEYNPNYLTARDAFRALWESINGAGSWDANPFVWVNEFKRVRP